MRKILIPSLMVCSLFAEQNFIELGVGYQKGKDNFSTESEKRISNYSNAKSENEGMAMLNFYYGADLSDDANIYVASQYGELMIGSEIGNFDFGVKGSLMVEAWENPYQLNQDRKKTDVQEFGGYIGYSIPFSDSYMAQIRYEYSTVDYDKDTVTNSKLKRDGKRHILSLENMIELNAKTNLIVTPIYEKYSADGKASSYENIGFEVTVANQITEDLELVIVGNVGKKDYDETNPILNKKIDATIIGIAALVKLDEPFGIENTFTSLTVGYEKEDANHNFYDKEEQYNIISIGYKF